MSTALITGANRGIGLELCRQLAARGDRVLAVCRKGSTELEALGVELISGVELTDADAVARLAGSLAPGSVDLLINNAGILTREGLDSMDYERVRQQFEVNALAPLRVTLALLDRLAPAARVVLMTSRMGSIADNGSGGYYGYRASKAALNAIGKSLAMDLRDRGVAVGIVHPGMVATAMTGHQGIPPAEAAAGVLARADGLSVENTGSFWHANGETLPW